MKIENRLSSLCVGEEGTVFSVCECGIKRRLMDIGLIPGTRVRCVGVSPLGDPCAYLIRGKTVAIRRRDAVKIKLSDKK